MVFLASWKITSSCFFSLICPGRPRFESSLFSNKKQSCSVCMHFIYSQHVACKDRAFIGKIFEPLKLLIDSSNWLNGNHKTGWYKEWPQDFTHTHTHTHTHNFPGGPVVKNRPANAGDVGLIPGPRRAHQLQSSKAPWATTIEPVPWSPWATTTETIYHNYWNHSAWRPCLATREASTTRSPCSATGEQPLLTTAREKPIQQKDPVQAKKRLIRSHISNTFVHFFSSLNKCPLSPCVPDPAKVFPSGKSRWTSLLEGRSSGNAPSRAELWPSEKAATTQKKEKSLHFLIQATLNDSMTREVADGLCLPPAFHYFLYCPVCCYLLLG